MADVRRAAAVLVGTAESLTGQFKTFEGYAKNSGKQSSADGRDAMPEGVVWFYL